MLAFASAERELKAGGKPTSNAPHPGRFESCSKRVSRSLLTGRTKLARL